MYSKARIAGHPIHPMLVALPIGMYVATVATLVAHAVTGDDFYYRVAMIASIAGVCAALVAAIPGAIDLFSLPRGSQPRLTAVKHGSVALLATGLFAVAAALLWHGWSTDVLDSTPALGFALAGTAALVIVGWLGWTLVQTHRVGVAPDILHPDISEPTPSPFLRTPAGRGELHSYRH